MLSGTVSPLQLLCGRQSVCRLRQRMGSRLSFLRCDTALLVPLASTTASCTALVSLCIDVRYVNSDCEEREMSAVFASLIVCPSLTELSITACAQYPRPGRAAIVHVNGLPRLRFLHIHVYSGARETYLRPPWSILTPNLTHLALVLHQSQLTSLAASIDSQRLPQLTHCHVSCNRLSTERTESIQARTRLKERLGAIWCDKEEYVVGWRADRVWRRSVVLLDRAEDYST